MVLGVFLITSCMENSKKSDKAVFTQDEDSTSITGWQSRYDRMEATDLPDNVIDLIGDSNVGSDWRDVEQTIYFYRNP